MSIQNKLFTLRKYMNKHNIDMYLIPSIDEHNSEYVPTCWQRRAWISNFNGSAGEVLVTKKHAYLWTDGRYFLQAQEQLDDKCYSLMRQTGFNSGLEEWLIQNAKGQTVGVDPRVVSVNRTDKLQKIMQHIGGKLILIDDNLIDLSRLALGDTLALPSSKAFYLADKYTGMSIKNKIKWLQNELNVNEVDYIALNVLDEIAWLFNIRGCDIEYNPLIISYTVVSKTNVFLFVDSDKINEELRDRLTSAGVTINTYKQFATYMQSIQSSILLDESTASFWMLSLVNKNAQVKLGVSPIVLAKSIKNATEIAGAKQAHIYDAVAVIDFLSWLSNNWQNRVDELSVVNKLSEFRARNSQLRGDSFATISGFASNGAVIHYHATPKTNKQIDDSNMFLLDSGGQYLDGTTDITRTVHFGEPTKTQKKHYTLVLKGHLALARAKFPHGTCGEHLDSLARIFLWSENLNYRHGTGHGVGSFLCVHEGPQRISPAISNVPLVPGMIVSNEPGYYLDGEYGIRIENLCLVTEIPNSENNGYGKFYGFDNLTLVPYCKKLLEFELLTPIEITQIKEYYKQINQIVKPILNKEAQTWLTNETIID